MNELFAWLASQNLFEGFNRKPYVWLDSMTNGAMLIVCMFFVTVVVNLIVNKIRGRGDGFFF